MNKLPHSIAVLCSLFFAGATTAAENVTYEVGKQAYEGYWSATGDNDAPLVLLVHDWDGLTEYEMKRSAMLTELGYDVFAVDLFGKGIRPTEMKDKRQHTGELYQNREKMRDLMQGAITQAKALGGNTDNMIIMGYCFGGAAVLETARAGVDSKGFVTFHGGLQTPTGQSYSTTKAPILVFHGTADTAITMQDFAYLADELEQSGIDHEMVTYGGAPHAFTVMGSDRYHQKADQQSWIRFTEFLQQQTQ
jgi:dienelactone hydrolase